MAEAALPAIAAPPAPSAATEKTALMDWDSPEDSGNPKNWGVAKKVLHTAIPGFFGFSVAFGTSVYAPGIPQVAEKLGVSIEVATLGISLYSLGLALGPMLGAPISEAKGRKAVYLLTLPIFLLFTAGAGLSKNIASLLVCRFFAAAAGSPSLAIGGGSVADMWEMQEGGGLAAVLVVQTFFLGPSLGPLIGGYALSRGTWNWLMWVMLLVSGPLYFVMLFASETSKKEILRRRSKERGLPQPPKPPPRQALKLLFMITLYRPIQMLLTEPIVAFWALYTSFVFGILFALFTAYPYVFEGVYDFTVAQSGLAFIGVFIGTVLAVLTFWIFDRTVYQTAKDKAQVKIPPPEERLYTSMLGSFGVPIALFWFAWTARTDIHWISPVLAGLPFGWGMSALFFSGVTYLVDTYDALYAASAIAANGLLRYIFGAVFPLFTIQMYEKLGVAWATSLLGFLSLLMLPIPWVLYSWGPALRARSSYTDIGASR